MAASDLPDFPWDLLEPAKARAAAHPDGIVDLSVGTPVDPVPDAIRLALAEGSDAPGYPPTAGTPALLAAITRWVMRSCGTSTRPGVLPTIGSKEMVAWLPTLLGIGTGDTVVIPQVCYPTYEVGALLAGADVVRADTVAELDESIIDSAASAASAASAVIASSSSGVADAGPRVKAIWLNSPANPTGRVLGTGHLREIVGWARDHGAIVLSDECYMTLGWDADPVSVLDDAVSGGDHTGVLAIHSLSKRSNLAGYRGAFASGDPGLIAELLEVRKHAGMIVPGPVQSAMIAALDDEGHVEDQRKRYAARRDALRGALTSAGFAISHSEAGLYLWSTRDENSWTTVDWLAERGILAAPGAFYGPLGERHVRIALTATDERIAAAVARLT
jgi:aspartate/methionine/tyrosine aminotransferase